MNLKLNLKGKNKLLLLLLVGGIVMLLSWLIVSYFNPLSDIKESTLETPQIIEETVKIKIKERDYYVEIADDPSEQSRGLMNIKFMEENKGMLFIFEDEAIRNFWMKSTYIPLDIIFINSDQKIIKIYKSTKPLDISLTYSSMVPAKYVLELNGGTTDKSQIQEGDFVDFQG